MLWSYVTIVFPVSFSMSKRDFLFFPSFGQILGDAEWGVVVKFVFSCLISIGEQKQAWLLRDTFSHLPFQASAIHLWTTPCAKRFERSSEQNFKEVITCGIVDFSSASIRVGAYYVYSAEAKSSERNTFALSTKKYSYDGIKFALLATILLCKCQCHYQLKHKCQILCFAEYKISKLSVNSPRMAEKMCTLSF